MGLFDGLSSRLGRVFGDKIPIIATDGSHHEIQAVFRREPFDIPNGDGTTTVTYIPTLGFDRRLLDTLGDKFKAQGTDGLWYVRTSAPTESGSPGIDAEVLIQMVRCDAPE